MTKNEFIEFVEKVAVNDWKERRIMLPSVVIAQACKESAFGTSELALKANALFGIKLNGWTGKSYRKKADEQNEDGTMRTDMDCLWRAYDSWEQSIIDHNTYIRDRKVGNQSQPNFFAIIGETNVKKVLAGFVGDENRNETADRCTDDELRQYVLDGKSIYPYATGIGYPQSMLDDYIDKYNLTTYDKEVNLMKIAIDAGHGSNTAGKRTPDGYREHYANVKVASYFAKAMDRCGVSYIKTGWNDDNALDDVDTSLSDRQKAIRNANCDYSISFHFNAYGDGKTYNQANGIETLISDKAAADSLRMATCIQNQLIKGTAQVNRGVKKQALAMCNCSVMRTKASVLIECAFMTNQREADLMKTDAFCLECAEEAAKGFCEYVGINYVTPGNNTTNQITHPEQQQTESCPVGTQKMCPFKVKCLDDLNIIKSPGGFVAKYNGCKKGIIYTIVQVSGNWGKLKSGAGWISILNKYVSKI